MNFVKLADVQPNTPNHVQHSVTVQDNRFFALFTLIHFSTLFNASRNMANYSVEHVKYCLSLVVNLILNRSSIVEQKKLAPLGILDKVFSNIQPEEEVVIISSYREMIRMDEALKEKINSNGTPKRVIFFGDQRQAESLYMHFCIQGKIKVDYLGLLSLRRQASAKFDAETSDNVALTICNFNCPKFEELLPSLGELPNKGAQFTFVGGSRGVETLDEWNDFMLLKGKETQLFRRDGEALVSVSPTREFGDISHAKMLINDTQYKELMTDVGSLDVVDGPALDYLANEYGIIGDDGVRILDLTRLVFNFELMDVESEVQSKLREFSVDNREFFDTTMNALINQAMDMDMDIGFSPRELDFYCSLFQNQVL